MEKVKDIVIKAEALGKKYVIGHQAENGRYTALRDVLMQNARTLWNKTKDMATGKPIIQGDTMEEVWALKDVSFEIRRGEVVGIIGRNGAGKSTLLKILSRITEPSTGRVTIRGRVASLLEVGTGFHPELSGRENIYLNGAILGMAHAEIKRKFDEIVDFAEVEKYLDTPVKRYSSGMYVRLAFAVAAHLEPEILVIDEVLAVGDAEFQKKCMGKMGNIAHEGRTVLFVSHNMSAVQGLCERVILLNKGSVQMDGKPQQVVSSYLSDTELEHEKVWRDVKNAPGNAKVRMHAVRIRQEGHCKGTVDIAKPIEMEVDYWSLLPGTRLHVSIHLIHESGVFALGTANTPYESLRPDMWYHKPYDVGLYRTVCTIPARFLNEAMYSVNAVVLSTIGATVEIFLRNIVQFKAREVSDVHKEFYGEWCGVVHPMMEWRTVRL